MTTGRAPAPGKEMSVKQLPSRALLAELRNLEQTASPAPWKTVRNNGAQIGQGEEWNARIIWSGPLHLDVAYLPAFQGREQSNADALTAVAARNALPILLDECDDLYALVREVAEVITESSNSALAARLAAAIAKRETAR